MGVLIALLGLFPLLAPRAAWYMQIGWQLKDAEPSPEALLMNRFSGCVMIVVGLFIMFN